MESINELTRTIIGCAIKVHRSLGPGLLESVYRECLYYELKKAKLSVQKELSLPIVYGEIKLDHGYRIDLLVENQVVLELKAIEKLNPVHEAQILRACLEVTFGDKKWQFFDETRRFLKCIPLGTDKKSNEVSAKKRHFLAQRVTSKHALTYQKLGGFAYGLLINFNVSLLKNGIKRFIMTNANE